MEESRDFSDIEVSLQKYVVEHFAKVVISVCAESLEDPFPHYESTTTVLAKRDADLDKSEG